LEKKGLLTVERRKSEMGPQRKFYSLNPDGEAYLKEFWTKWTFLAEKMKLLEEK